MAIYRLESVVDAPLEAVWEFYVRAGNLAAVTPGFVNVTIDGMRRADSTPVEDPDSTPMTEGAEVDVRTRPFGLWESSWTSTVTELERADDRATFVDCMQDGPFELWDHTHRFTAIEDDRTEIHDVVEYRLPLPAVGKIADPFAVIGFEPMFRYRHRRTKSILE